MMTGNALMDFLIAIVSLIVVGALFFVAIEKVAPDEFFKKVARIAIGGVLIIALLFAIKGVLFGGTGLAVSPLGIIWFAVGLLVAMVVLYLIYLALDWLAATMGDSGWWLGPVKYVIGAIVLIALLILAANTMFGVRIGGFGDPRRSDTSPPFQLAGGVTAAVPARPAANL